MVRCPASDDLMMISVLESQLHSQQGHHILPFSRHFKACLFWNYLTGRMNNRSSLSIKRMELALQGRDGSLKRDQYLVVFAETRMLLSESTTLCCRHCFHSNAKEIDFIKPLVKQLLLASKICAENKVCIEEGITYACKALSLLHGKCRQMASIANYLRKLDIALYYAKQLLKLEAGANVKGYILFARVLSAQKRFVDAETIINGALDQTGKWDQEELLRTKAKLQRAQDRLKNATETYTHLLAVLQVRTKSFGSRKNLPKI